MDEIRLRDSELEKKKKRAQELQGMIVEARRYLNSMGVNDARVLNTQVNIRAYTEELSVLEREVEEAEAFQRMYEETRDARTYSNMVDKAREEAVHTAAAMEYAMEAYTKPPRVSAEFLMTGKMPEKRYYTTAPSPDIQGFNPPDTAHTDLCKAITAIIKAEWIRSAPNSEGATSYRHPNGGTVLIQEAAYIDYVGLVNFFRAIDYAPRSAWTPEEGKKAIDEILVRWKIVEDYPSTMTRKLQAPTGEQVVLSDLTISSKQPLHPELFSLFVHSKIQENPMTDMRKFINGAIKDADQKKKGEEIVSGKRSASEVFGKVPPKKELKSSLSDMVTLPVDDIMKGLDELEAVRLDLVGRGMVLDKVDVAIDGASEVGALCLKLVRAAHKKGHPSVVVKAKEWEQLDNASQWVMGDYKTRLINWTTEQNKLKGEYAALPGEHGDIWLTNTHLKILTASVRSGKDVLLTGEPGTSKTDTARALALATGRKLFHMEVSGLSDVSQLEAERYIEERNGASVTTSMPTALINALEAHEAGDSVLLVIDEIARVTDPSILNPLMLLMSHGEFHAVVGKKTYTIDRKRFVIFATANIMAGFNFSGNSRRGMDDALMDRFRIIQMERAPVKLIEKIVADRVDFRRYDTPTVNKMLEGINFLYSMANQNGKASDDVRRLITVRSMIDVASGWVDLDPRVYTLAETVDLLLSPKAKNAQAITTVTSALEAKGM